MLDLLRVPVVLAPMAGGPSTPALAAAVSDAGGLGFLAAGYRTADAMAGDIAATRALTAAPIGVNVFCPDGDPADPETVAAFAARVRGGEPDGAAALGEARHDDDDYAAKVERLIADPVAAVSFTFGCPDPALVTALRRAGSAVWVTVTSVAEAKQAAGAGADALIVQGAEAGGHRGAFVDGPERIDTGLLALLQLIAAAVDVPLVAAGGIATGGGLAAVLAAGAAAAQIGTAFLLCPEAGTADAVRHAVASDRPTGITRAFSGRAARGIVNRWQAAYTDGAPVAYPEVHHLTAPLRARARAEGDADRINLWAGEGHALARAVPAAEVLAALHREAVASADAARRRLDGPR